MSRISPIETEGRIAQVVINCTDSTERKGVEEALRREKEFTDTALDAQLDTFFLFEPATGKALRWNRAFREVSGYSDEEIVRMPAPASYYSPEDLARAGYFVEKVLEEGTGTIELELVCKDGRKVPTEYRVSVINDDQEEPRYFISIGRDISERKQAEQALQRRTEEVKLLYEAGQQLSQTLNTDIIYDQLYESLSHIMDCDVLVLSSFDPEDKLIRCVFASIEGERQEVSGYPPVPLNPDGRGTQSVAIHTGNSLVLRDYQAWMKTSQKMYYIDKGGVVVDHEKAPDDVDVTRSALIVPMKLKGQVVGVIQVMSYRFDAYSESNLRILESLASQIAVATNNALLYQQAQNEIAERVRAEETLKAYSERLEEMVEERTRDLREAQERLIRQEKLAVLGQLAGGVGHELRNPLGAIKNAAYFLHMVLKDPDPETRQMLEILDKEVATAEKIISSLLDFARPKLPLRQKVDVNNVLQEAVARIIVPDAPRVEVVSQLTEGLPSVLGDPDHLAQVFGNLILNAVQAMPGGGRLIVRTDMEGPEWVTASIADTGVGISAENLKKIFEPLFTTKAKGIGLGLALVKTLVEGQGGTIEAQSAGVPGQGSTFTIRLPIDREAGPEIDVQEEVNRGE